MNTLTSKTKTGLVGMGLMSMSLALGCDLNDRDSAEREAQEDLREAQEEVREAQAELREAKAEIERLNARTQQKVETRTEQAQADVNENTAKAREALREKEGRLEENAN